MGSLNGLQIRALNEFSHWGRIQRKTWCMGPYAGVDYILTLNPLQSRLQVSNTFTMGIGQRATHSRPKPYARFAFYPPVRVARSYVDVSHNY